MGVQVSVQQPRQRQPLGNNPGHVGCWTPAFLVTRQRRSRARKLGAVPSSSSAAAAASAKINTCMRAFNYGGSLPPAGVMLANFSAVPPELSQDLEDLSDSLTARLVGPIAWSVDVHFAPRSERDLIACFAGHQHREGMTPVALNESLSSGCACRWLIASRGEIGCSPIRGARSTTYPCQISTHPSRLLIAFTGHYGITTADLDDEGGRFRHGSNFSHGEVFKSLALSPCGCLTLALIRVSHGFHLRVVRHGTMLAVENEVRLSRLIPSLRLGRTYTETGHCAWSPDGRRVGFACSTGHCGVLLRLPHHRFGGHRRYRDRASRSGISGSRLGSSSIWHDDDEDLGGLWLEWSCQPSEGAGLSAPRAFAFWPGFLTVADANNNSRCLWVLALGRSGGHIEIVAGFSAASEINQDEEDADLDEVVACRQLQLCDVGSGDDDAIQVLRFSSSGNLLAVGWLSGRVLVMRSFGVEKSRTGLINSPAGDSYEEFCLQPLISMSTANGSGVTSLDIADTEAVLAAGDISGRISVWRLPPSSSDAESEAPGATVEALKELCFRAVASACRLGCAGRLPLPRSLLTGVCVNREDRKALTRPLSSPAGAARGVSNWMYHISFF